MKIEIAKMSKSGNFKSKFQKKCQKLREIQILKMLQTAGNSNSQNVKYCGEIQIPKMSKSAGKFELKFLKSQKLREIPIPKR